MLHDKQLGNRQRQILQGSVQPLSHCYSIKTQLLIVMKTIYVTLKVDYENHRKDVGDLYVKQMVENAAYTGTRSIEEGIEIKDVNIVDL